MAHVLGVNKCFIVYFSSTADYMMCCVYFIECSWNSLIFEFSTNFLFVELGSSEGSNWYQNLS